MGNNCMRHMNSNNIVSPIEEQNRINNQQILKAFLPNKNQLMNRIEYLNVITA